MSQIFQDWKKETFLSCKRLLFYGHHSLTLSFLNQTITAIAKNFQGPPRDNKDNKDQGPRINRQIRADLVRVVDPGGEHGIYTVEEALELAEKRGLDLVEVAPEAKPPVCKIIDFGKFRYEQQKKDKEAKKKAHTVVLKEIRFGPHTDDHDFNFKLKHAEEFLTEGNKVKAYVQFKGRAIMYSDQGTQLLTRFVEALKEIAKVDQPPKLEGKRMSTILSPGAKKK